MRAFVRAGVRAGLVLAAALPLVAGPLVAQKPDRKKATRDLITLEQIQQNPQLRNAYELVEALHGQWLVPRAGTLLSSPATAGVSDTMGGMVRTTAPVAGVPGEAAGVRVYVDRVYLGHVEELKSIPVANIQWIRYYVGNDAQQEFGMGNSAGVILVSTQRE